MAVIEIGHDDVNQLVGDDLTIAELAEDGSMLGILFEDTDKEDVIAVEVEPNRPDLLSVEGVARALRGFFEIDTGIVEYPVQDSTVTVTVDDSVEAVRPYIGCARVSGLEIDDTVLNSIVQLQEKLTQTYGRKRAKIAIGLHDAADITAPYTYTAVDPDSDEYAFTPLGRDAEMTPAEILDEHEKGQEYGWIIADHDRYPLIHDADGTVLSMPPVINGTVTEVTTDTTDIFVDVTGTAEKEVRTALRIICAALHERGGTIEAVDVDGDAMPDMAPRTRTVDADYVRDVTGLDLSGDEMAANLERLNYAADADGDTVTVQVPAYRADIMHSYDIIEDIVIGYGYGDVPAELPEVATVGGQTDTRAFINTLRDVMVGAGAQELMTFILSNRAKLFDRMDRDEEPVVAMANPLTEEYTVVRHRLLPSLLETLGDNTHNRYPQDLFEVGRCSRLSDDTVTGADDVWRMAYVTADTGTDFTDARSVLQSLGTALGIDLAVEAADRASFADDRCGVITLDGAAIGVIGEVSDSVRGNWGVDVPVAAFELAVEPLRDAVQD